MSEINREIITKFVKEYHDKNGTVPTVSTILNELKGEGYTIYNQLLYQMFPGKLEEIARAAGLEVPEDRIKLTERATQGRMHPPEPAVIESTKITLNEEQSRRIFGISHMEGGVDPSLLLDRLIERDTQIRSYGLSSKEEKHLYLCALSLRHVDRETLHDLVAIVHDLRSLKWAPGVFVSELNRSASLLSIGTRYLVGKIDAQTALTELAKQ